MIKRIILNAFFATTVAACGGSNSSENITPIIVTSPTPDPTITPTPTPVLADGIFKDSNVVGLSYSSGSQVGVTDANGHFVYEIGESVTFYIGCITLGVAIGKGIITPVDLVNNSDSSNREVQNIVRFLMMLDSDGDPDNGITISPTINTIADTWTQVDFDVADLSAALVNIISDAASADGGTHILPDANTAQMHLESTLRCTYAGVFVGSFAGGDRGHFGLMVDAITGAVFGTAYSMSDNAFIALSGGDAISYDQLVTFSNGNAASGATFGGQFATPDNMNGEWENSLFNLGGTFSADRVGGSVNAIHRFTGVYSGGDEGLFSFDVDSGNNVTGVVYSYIDNELITLTGTVNGTLMSANLQNGTVISSTIAYDMQNENSGGLNGLWSNANENISGTLSGSGCLLN